MISSFLPPTLPAERVRACVGLISDTHMPQRLAALPSAVFSVFQGVDLLLHAGDVGNLAVLDQLSTIAPVIAVHGNDDTPEAQTALPYQQVITVHGQRILLWHSHFPDRVDELYSRRHDEFTPYSASILAPELEANLDYLRTQFATMGFEQAMGPWLRVAHRCWAGAQATMTLADLRQAVAADPELSPNYKAQYLAILTNLPHTA